MHISCGDVGDGISMEIVQSWSQSCNNYNDNSSTETGATETSFRDGE